MENRGIGNISQTDVAAPPMLPLASPVTYGICKHLLCKGCWFLFLS